MRGVGIWIARSSRAMTEGVIVEDYLTGEEVAPEPLNPFPNEVRGILKRKYSSQTPYR